MSGGTAGSDARKRFGLLLDLSHAGFAAVFDESDESGTQLLAASSRPAGTRHDDVAVWTEALLKEAGGSFSRLAWITVGVGPGSFTGIRIAMAFAQGLALPLNLPVAGFTSFEALFLSARSAGVLEGDAPALAVIPANTGRFYVAASLDDAGALITGEELAERLGKIAGEAGGGSTSGVVITSEATSALKAMVDAAPRPVRIWSPDAGSAAAGGHGWDAGAIAQRARAAQTAQGAGRGLVRPVYLQLSAAEEKFGPADVAGADL